MVSDFVILEAEDCLDEGIDVDVAGHEIPIPQTDTAGDCGAPEEILSGHGAHPVPAYPMSY
jgi:hypothetical protein